MGPPLIANSVETSRDRVREMTHRFNEMGMSSSDLRWAGGRTRRSYQRDWHCWFGFCVTHDLHPYRDTRRTHVELYLRELEHQLPRPSNATRYRRISTLSSWFAWLEDEE